jgi:hypothetical protein
VSVAGAVGFGLAVCAASALVFVLAVLVVVRLSEGAVRRLRRRSRREGL